MIYHLETCYRTLRRWFNRSEWIIHLLGIKSVSAAEAKTGLIIIQIDGLSHEQMKIALANKRLPFLQKLISREHYHLHHLFSGVPSTTPAVQAELFYGVKTAVPAFSFISKRSQQVVRMDRSEASKEVEKKLEVQAEALLKGGSSYSNIYRGGALEANFCSSSIGWYGLSHMASPTIIIVFVLVNMYSFVRVGVLMIVELFLAIVDFLRGIISRRDLLKELLFVPTRVAISILLRELVTIGAKLDAVRGLPIIHLNFLGYDEQSHRRGPSSKFAHWSLKGIDDAVGRVWRAAKSSPRRTYDIWIYSDHGQAETTAYNKLYAETVTDAVKRVFADINNLEITQDVVGEVVSIESQRVKYIGGKWLKKILPCYHRDLGLDTSSQLQSIKVTSMGPMGSIYLAKPLSTRQTEELAIALIHNAKIPLVFACIRNSLDKKRYIKAWNKNGVYQLPRDGSRLFGAKHPFLQEVTEDMVRLCKHPESGALLISGWSLDEPYCSFAMENGAHGGPSPQETSAFALLPCDTPLPSKQNKSLRPCDLYDVGMHILGRKKTTALQAITHRSQSRPKHTSLRILTYNVHSCICMDGKLDPRRIAKVIDQYKPDIVALQELDVSRLRTKHTDQAHIISQFLKMEFHFHPVIHVQEERYGNAILTHLPLKLIKAGNLPLLANRPSYEPRGVIWGAVNVKGTKVHIINTHFGFRKEEQLPQVTALLSQDWLRGIDDQEPIILCGDFNFSPNTPAYNLLVERFQDLQIELNGHRPLKTFAGRFPSARIDYIFANTRINTLNIQVPRTHLTRNASDHLPLIADVQLLG